MRTKTSNWFVCKVNYERQRENGLFAKVNEMYVLEAVSWADAEETITKELQSLLSGEFVIKDISIAPYSEVFFSDMVEQDKWYKVVVALITLDAKSGKEKRSNITYLVQAKDTEQAQQNVRMMYANSMYGYSIIRVIETKVMDVFECNTKNTDEQ